MEFPGFVRDAVRPFVVVWPFCVRVRRVWSIVDLDSSKVFRTELLPSLGSHLSVFDPTIFTDPQFDVVKVTVVICYQFKATNWLPSSYQLYCVAEGFCHKEIQLLHLATNLMVKITRSQSFLQICRVVATIFLKFQLATKNFYHLRINCVKTTN